MFVAVMMAVPVPAFAASRAFLLETHGVMQDPSGPSGGSISPDNVAENSVVDRVAWWTAEAVRRRDAGDLVGAISAWEQATRIVPVIPATAQQRAALALALAGAHAALAVGPAAATHLQRAIIVLDNYLALLDPRDDENRAQVEHQRELLAVRLHRVQPAAAAKVGPAPRVPVQPARGDRRLLRAGAVSFGLGGAGVGMMVAGLAVGLRADRALSAAVERSGDDPLRESLKQSAQARGLGANRLAVAGAAVAGVFVVVGTALMVAGALRPQRPVRPVGWTVHGLRWQF